MRAHTPTVMRRAWMATRAQAPGLVAAATVAATAWSIAAVAPFALGAVPIAIVIGILAGQWLPREPLAAGLGLASRRILRIGIVLLGVRLSLSDIGTIGIVAVGLVVITIAVGLAAAWWLGRRLGCDRTVTVLIGVGSAICGNSAILATGPMINAKARDTGLAVATITLCGSVALIAYPILGAALGLGDQAFGLLAGLAIQDTAQVVAAAAAYSDGALEIATVVKLIRNAAMAIVLPLVAWWWTRRGGETAHVKPHWAKAVPGFVLGFVVMVALRSIGVITDEVAVTVAQGSNVAILVAVSALGLSIVLADLRTTSRRAVGLGAIVASLLGIIALAMAVIVGPQLA